MQTSTSLRAGQRAYSPRTLSVCELPPCSSLCSGTSTEVAIRHTGSHAYCTAFHQTHTAFHQTCTALHEAHTALCKAACACMLYIVTAWMLKLMRTQACTGACTRLHCTAQRPHSILQCDARTALCKGQTARGECVPFCLTASVNVPVLRCTAVQADKGSKGAGWSAGATVSYSNWLVPARKTRTWTWCLRRLPFKQTEPLTR